jgi:uncharacterized radical SAM superfamily Fe-S cluster-containing enzyme
VIEERTAEEVSQMVEAFMKPFPEEAIKSRKGGHGKDLDYVEGHTVIHRLIKATGGQYSTEYLSHFILGNSFYVWLRVIVPGLGHHDGLGVAAISEKAEDVLKGAATDAVKNASKYFGIALQLYGDDYEAPVVVPPKQRLSQLLAYGGIRSKAAANAAANEKFGKDLDKLSESDIMTWVTELEQVAV